MVGPFGMESRGTMRVRALPMASALVGLGHEVTMLLPPWRHPEEAGRRWEQDGVAVENVRLPAAIPGVFQAVTALRLARRALNEQPDVVHLFKPKAYSGLVHWLLHRLPRRWRPRLVVDADDWEGPGGWNEVAGYSALQRRFFTWQERWGLAHADAVTVASRTLEGLVWAMGASPERVVYVPNGIRSGAQPRPEEGSDTGCILLYTRFFEFPVSRVIDLLRLVRERVPQASLLVVGKGLFGEEEELFQMAAEAGFEVARPDPAAPGTEPHDRADVTYVGWVPPERLPRYFAQADVAIYPFEDSLVNRTKCAVKLLDLLAAGVPVVAEAVGQNRESIRDGETGLLVQPGEVGSFAECVVELLTDAAFRRTLGQAARRDVRERFAWRDLVRDVEQAYGISA